MQKVGITFCAFDMHCSKNQSLIFDFDTPDSEMALHLKTTDRRVCPLCDTGVGENGKAACQGKSWKTVTTNWPGGRNIIFEFFKFEDLFDF